MMAKCSLIPPGFFAIDSYFHSPSATPSPDAGNVTLFSQTLPSTDGNLSARQFLLPLARDCEPELTLARWANWRHNRWPMSRFQH